MTIHQPTFRLDRVGTVEEDFHVLDRVDGDAGHAHVARYPRVVRIVPDRE